MIDTKAGLVWRPFRLRAARCAVVALALAGFAFAAERPDRPAIDRAHAEIWRRFIGVHGHLLDYTGLDGSVHLPTPEECRQDKPNALGWATPIENGAFLGGLYLDALCNRWRVTGEAATAERARKLAAGLLLLGEIGGTPGFVARGVANDGRTHYVASSSDQTYPWIYGLWRYANSGLPDAAERARVNGTLRRVIEGLERRTWEMPIDRADFGHFGHWSGGFAGTKGILVGAEPDFDAAARLLFVHRVMHQITGDESWREKYRVRLHERPAGSELTRLEICARGVDYVQPGQPPQFPARPRLWTSASSQAGLRALWEWEDDPRVRDSFRRGLDGNAARAARSVAGGLNYDNNNTLAFDVDWRQLNVLWEPQRIIGDAVTLGRRQKGEGGLWGKISPRFDAESIQMRDPLFAAWVFALANRAGDFPGELGSVRRLLTHYRWDRLHTGFFFMAECVYWQLAADELRGADRG